MLRGFIYFFLLLILSCIISLAVFGVYNSGHYVIEYFDNQVLEILGIIFCYVLIFFITKAWSAADDLTSLIEDIVYCDEYDELL